MKKPKFLLVLLLMMIATLVAIRMIGNDKSSKPTEVSYTDFIRMIESEKVAKIELTEDSSNIAAVLAKDGSQVLTTVPNQEMFVEYIQGRIISGSEIQIILNEEETSFVMKFLDGLMSFVFIVYFSAIAIWGIRFLRKALKKSNSNNSTGNSLAFSNPFNTDINYIEKMVKSDIRFSDVAGLDEEKAELEEVVDFMKDPEKYTQLGAKIPKGVLLSGSPGTGKTLLAKAVAGEAGISYLAISGSEFIEKYVGVGASRIRGLFKEARKNTPCIIFIDEIDAIGAKRSDDGGGSSEHNQTLEQLLTELDGFKGRTDIVVLAATNRLSSLDPALVRPGRFDRQINVSLPDIKGREDILKIHGKDKPFMDDVDFKKIAYNTAGFSGAELENLLNEAALMAARHKHEVISSSDIDSALKKITVGLQKTGRVVSEKERKITAVHESGHAIVSKFLSTQANIKEISIVPRGKAGGYTWHDTVEDKHYISKTEFKEKMIVLMAGRVAEEVVLGDISTGASNDLEVATRIAREMIMLYGMDKDLGPVSFADTDNDYYAGETLNNIWKKITDLLKESEEEARKLVLENRKLLDALTDKLLNEETVFGPAFDELFQRYKQTLVANTN